jgi:hypothetical protein
MRWIFIVARNSTIEKVKIFDNYFQGELHTNEYLRLAFGVEEDFPEYRKGIYYKTADGISIGLYKDNS